MGRKFADQYSLIHFATGVIANYLGLSFGEWFMIHLLFELLENTKTGMNFINTAFPDWPGGKEYPDSLTNSIGDQIFAIIGWLFAKVIINLGLKYNWHD